MIFGTSLKDISPKLGVELAGYPHCPRPNKGVHDPLYAACLYINDGEKEFALVTFDLLYFGKKLTKQLRDKFGFEIMCTTTHTHSGPWASTVLASEEAEGIKCNEEYIEFLMATVESAIEEARTNTFEGEIGTGVGRCGKELGVGGNRRVKNGVQDDAVNVLSVRDKEGKVRCVLLNYALHPTYLHAENELCTADYPCYFRRFMHFAQPDAMAMFAQGCSGDQSSRYHRVAQDFEEAAIAKVECMQPFLEDLLPLEDVDVYLISDLADCIGRMEETDGELLKFCAALEVERPGLLMDAVDIACDLDNYERITVGAYEYGQSVLRRHGADEELLQAMEGYMDFEKLGADAMIEDGVRETEFGLIRRLSKPFPEQENGPRIGGM